MAHPATRFTISQKVPFGKVDILRREIERRGPSPRCCRHGIWALVDLSASRPLAVNRPFSKTSGHARRH